MQYDAIIVGAGPAGLFAAREMIRGGLKVAIIDKGRNIESRTCPMKDGRSDKCLHCKPCNIICGWGELEHLATVS